ncbi:MAG: hypothetical protein K0R24_1520 [Gammaproteobacteria bacterium]|jgi:hypothetical protein|nr:hypothetical protein [Gammaproteobacteria bacterium]
MTQWYRNIKSYFNGRVNGFKNREIKKIENSDSLLLRVTKTEIKELIQTTPVAQYTHWSNDKFRYEECVRRFADRFNCNWLIDEIGRVLFPKIVELDVKSDPDVFPGRAFYKIELNVHTDCTAILTFSDSFGDEMWFNQIIERVCLPLLETPVRFWLSESSERDYYCLALSAL